MKCDIKLGDALNILKSIEDCSIQSTITSPPYFHLRTYTLDNTLEIGREKTINEYIQHLSEIFFILLQKTKEDGLFFLNLGDTYNNGNLLGIPWRVALSLIDVGWILRSDIIWRKPNAMPSSVKNRPTVDHEYIFMFAKSHNYFYDQDAIREPHITFTSESKMKGGRNHFWKKNGTPEQGKNEGNKNLHDGRWDQAFHPLGRNKRTVWDIPLGKFKGCHFAVFPEKLVEICIKMSSKKGSLICDPFLGSGTTAISAMKLQRNFIGCDINKEYIEISNTRINNLDIYKNCQLTLL